MTVTISVYEKRGPIKRGNPILDAEFRQAVVLSASVTAFPVLSATGGGPLGEPKYAVELLSSPVRFRRETGSRLGGSDSRAEGVDVVRAFVASSVDEEASGSGHRSKNAPTPERQAPGRRPRVRGQRNHEVLGQREAVRSARPRDPDNRRPQLVQVLDDDGGNLGRVTARPVRVVKRSRSDRSLRPKRRGAPGRGEAAFADQIPRGRSPPAQVRRRRRRASWTTCPTATTVASDPSEPGTKYVTGTFAKGEPRMVGGRTGAGTHDKPTPRSDQRRGSPGGAGTQSKFCS
jgi:hypothetical protein